MIVFHCQSCLGAEVPFGRNYIAQLYHAIAGMAYTPGVLYADNAALHGTVVT